MRFWYYRYYFIYYINDIIGPASDLVPRVLATLLAGWTVCQVAAMCTCALTRG